MNSSNLFLPLRIRSALACLAGAALALGGCDMGDRRAGAIDAGMDGGGDADSDSDTDGYEDTETGADWRYEDAGDSWHDGSAEVDGPCGNDCRHIYDLVYLEWDDIAGRSSFELSPGGADLVEARGLESYRYVLWYHWPDYELYRQRLLSEWVLDETSHDLVSGQATVYNVWGGTTRLRAYEFAWDDDSGSFAWSVDFDGRGWSGSASAQRAPLVMFNLHEFPLRGFGCHGTLFAFLLGERYDWDQGGKQLVEVFSPEVERLIDLEIEAVGEQTLAFDYPAPTTLPIWHSSDNPEVTHDRNRVQVEYDQGIPLRFGTRAPYQMELVTATPFELNLGVVPPSEQVSGPALSDGYTTTEIPIASGSLELAGAVDDPAAPGPHPAVVLAPGWSHRTRLGEVGAVNLYEQLADHLATAGYLVLRIDARGNGDSQGELEESTLDELIADTGAMVSAVAALEEADAERVFLLTIGWGAHVAAGAAADPENGVAGVILLGPEGRSFEERGDEVYGHYLESCRFHSDFVVEERFEMMDIIESLSDGSYEGNSYRGHGVEGWQSMMELDLVENPVQLPATLILHGAEDHLVPPEDSDLLRDALEGEGTEVTRHRLEGVTHAMTPGTAAGAWPEHGSAETLDSLAVDRLFEWLDAQTGGGE